MLMRMIRICVLTAYVINIITKNQSRTAEEYCLKPARVKESVLLTKKYLTFAQKYATILPLKR